MDIKRFTNEITGKLVPIQAEWGSDHAFIPAPLPPDWEFPNHLWPLLADAKGQINLLEGIGRGLPNPAILLRPLTGREAIQSSALEGTFATPEDLLRFELNPQDPSSEDDRINSHLEVSNYRKALEHGTTSELPISLRFIRDLHRILLLGVRGKDKSPGDFRRVQVGIGAGGRFIPPPHLNVMECLDKFEKYYHHRPIPYDPLVDCFLIHYQFEAIHPFGDGNGRIGRLLLAIMLQQRCKLTEPWLYMSGFYNRHRDEYIQRLFNISTKGDWSAWIEFCLQGVLEQAKDTITRCEKLRQIKEKYMQQLQNAKAATRLIQVVDAVFENPLLWITDLSSLMGVSDPTARSDAQRLVDIGILQELQETRPKIFYAPDVFNIAYENLD